MILGWTVCVVMLKEIYTSTRYGKGTVAKFSQEGKLLLEVQMKGKKPSNIAFGGKDGKTAYVTPSRQGLH